MGPSATWPPTPPVEPGPPPPVLTRAQPATMLTATQFWLEGENLTDVERVTWNRDEGDPADCTFDVVDDEFIQGVTPNGFPNGTGLVLYFTAYNQGGPSNQVTAGIGSP